MAESGGGSGVESPGLIWIPRGLAYGRLPWLVSHEVAHQWFYGIVGNDQAREPFADEAMADFLARYLTGTRRASRCAADTLDRSIYAYSASCYFEVVYVQGGLVLDGFRRRMGSTAFWAAVRDYLGANRFGLGGTRLLLETLDAHTPLDLLAPVRWRFPRRSDPQPTVSARCASSRSTKTAWASFIRRRASSGANQATRSISGNSASRPEPGGHSIVNVLLTLPAGSRSPSQAHAQTTLPPFWPSRRAE